MGTTTATRKKKVKMVAKTRKRKVRKLKKQPVKRKKTVR